MSTVEHGVVKAPSEEPDAVCRGWWAEPDGEREGALFMLAGTAMGVSVTDTLTGDLARPEWVDLATVVHLDALGEPDGGIQTVELGLSTGTVRTAGWTGPFCDAVVDALQRLVAALAAAPAPTQAPVPAGPPAVQDGPSGDDPLPPAVPPAPAPPVLLAPETTSVPSPFAPAGPPPGGEDAAAAPAVHVTPLPEPGGPVLLGAPAPDLPPPAVGQSSATPPPFTAQPPVAVPEPAAAPPATPPAGLGTSLVLEDVVYLGGHPDEAKKKKRCTATLTETSVVVDGPGEMSIAVPWSGVTSVEVQNSDEARFRMNLRVHRDASAVVLTQHDGTKVLLEARDCPTIPLRSAIVQLLVDQPVEVA